MINADVLRQMKTCRHLLPEPGPGVVGELVEEIERMDGIILACHRAFDGGSPHVREAAKLLAKEQVKFAGGEKKDD